MPPKRRRAYGEGSISRNARGLWVGKIEAGYSYGTDGTPRRRRLEKSSKSHAVVLEWMAATKADVARYGRTADPAITVQTWAARWLTDICSPRLKPSSMHTYRMHTQRWIVPTIGRKRLAKLTPADVRAVLQAVRDAGRTSTTARSVRTVMSGMLTAAVREGLLTDNVAARVDTPALTPSTRGYLTADQTRTVLRLAADTAGGSMHIAALLTGMRHAETLGLLWECVDLPAGMLTVAWQLQRPSRDGSALRLPDGMRHRQLTPRAILVPPKSGKTRTVPILPPLAAALARHRQATADQPNPHGLVWHTPAGQPLSADTERRRWADLMETAGLPRTVTPHWARHSVATLLMEAGVDAKIIGEIVGHASVELTRNTYQHLSSEQARLGMAKLGELVSG